jgi:hypothetical protein
MCWTEIEYDIEDEMKSYPIRKHLVRVYSASKNINQLVLSLPHDNYKIYELNGNSFDSCLREALRLHFEAWGE